MNNKGLTLVEIVAVLVVLSVIAIIVTPNVMSNISKYRSKMYEAQMNSISDGAKNWTTDHIDLVPTDGTTAIALSLSELQKDGYVDENIKNPNGGTFDEISELFSVVYVTKIEDSTGKLDTNYKYFYGTYENILEYEKAAAIEYKKNHTKSNEVATVTLKNEGYLPQTLQQIEIVNNIVTKSDKEIPAVTIGLGVTTEDDETKYTAYIKE